MAKERSHRSPRRLESVPDTNGTSAGPRRLEGDALFAWATMQAEARQLQQQMEGFVQMRAQELGFDPQQETIDMGGYIRPIQRSPAPLQVPDRASPVPPEGRNEA